MTREVCPAVHTDRERPLWRSEALAYGHNNCYSKSGKHRVRRSSNPLRSFLPKGHVAESFLGEDSNTVLAGAFVSEMEEADLTLVSSTFV